ncbi:MAG: ASKHA domain-containing protein, partial [Planctomycetaceae bacterium]|nr:ASKHA domain-containing protein [Planctomycetaceae bacterium]
ENVEVVTENKEHENRTLKILSDGQSFSYPLKPFISKRYDGEKTIVYGGETILGTENGDTSKLLYGITIDIGTTTLVMAITNLSDGNEIGYESRLNPQSTYAQDVLSRIHFASNNEGLKTLQNILIEVFNEMITAIANKTKIDTRNIYEIVYSGNTAMLHLACGINPKPLGQYPYTSQIHGGEHLAASKLNISPFGLIYLPPVISAFVGPDITSGILASQLYEQKDTILFIDIGTNGEIVLAKNGRLAATSTAAGPAFEGMNITCGMRAGNGAIERFHLNDNGNIDYQVIGNVCATGICGSGLLDITGELVRNGIIGKNGRFSSQKNIDGLREKDGKKVFFITDDVYVTQNDVRQVQLAKGAIRSGVEALLMKMNLKKEEVNRVEIAGSFGYHLNEKSLLNIGLLPLEFEGKVTFVGNTAQSGGTAFLLNTDFRTKMRLVVSEIQKIELADNENFEKLFVASLGF